MKTGQKKRLLGRERWFEAIKEEETLQRKKDITVQCVDVCEATTSKMHAVLLRLAKRNLPTTSMCSGGNCWIPRKPTPLPADTPCCHVPGLSRCIHLLRVLAVTESQEAQVLLDEIQQQPSVFVLSGPAIVITSVTTASALLSDGWSTESVSRVERTARTRQENNEKERAEHAYYSHIHDEVTISDAFPGAHQTRRQISRIHENMEHPSFRTLARVLRLGGAKRRFIQAAAKHSRGAREAKKRPAGPIVGRSPSSFVFNDVVGLHLFFLKQVRKSTPCLP